MLETDFELDLGLRRSDWDWSSSTNISNIFVIAVNDDSKVFGSHLHAEINSKSGALLTCQH